MLCSIDEEYKESLTPILASKLMINSVLKSNDKNSLDPAIPSFVSHCDFWGKHFGGSFDLIHDESKPILQKQKMLEDLMSRGEKEHVIGYDQRKFIFPLRAKEINFCPSHNDPRLQIADLIASATAYWASGLISDQNQKDFLKKLKTAGIGRFLAGGLWPRREILPEKLGTEFTDEINATNYIAEFLSKHR
jgi:hypothetical protein